MNNEDNFSPQESLQLIESMLAKAKNSFSDNSLLYLLWGWVVLFCAIANFVTAWFHWLPRPDVVWGFTWLAAIFQVVFLAKQKKKAVVKNYSEEILAAVWIAFVVCMFVSGSILAINEKRELIYPILLVLYGFPTFISGTIMRFKPLKIGGICCWFLALISTFFPLQFALLFLALSVVVAWIIPGYLLQQKFKKENS